MIPINVPKINQDEIDAVINVMRGGILTNALGMGPMVKKFEEKFSKFVKSKYAIAVNSGTAALHAAVIAAGVKNGDEVIIPSFTFVATAEAVVMAGAKPIFVDIDPLTYNISPMEIGKAITNKTKAIIAVDIYGLSAEFRKIKTIAIENKLTLIEDAAQAHGTEYYGKSPGSFADMACWSFYASKNMTTGEGGIITTNDKKTADKIKMLRTHGEKEKYTSKFLGYNYRMPEISAAIGVVQLDKIGKFIKKRERNANQLNGILKKCENIKLPKQPLDYKHSWYLYTVRLKNYKRKERDKMIEALKSKGIGAEAYYSNPVHLMPYYRNNFGEHKIPVTERAAEQVISLPVHPQVTDTQIDYIGKTFIEIFESTKKPSKQSLG